MLPLKHIHHKKKHHASKRYSYQFLDYMVYFIAFAGPIMTIPQIYDIWVKKSLAVNEITWGSYVLIATVWLYYGVVHEEKPIIFSNVLWIIAAGMVFLGGIL